MQRSQSWIIPTVMSPEKGGPVYNQLRANFAYTRRMIQRHPFRWIHDNWDFERQALVNVPDYVFEDDYPLRSLDELRGFIQKH